MRWRAAFGTAADSEVMATYIPYNWKQMSNRAVQPWKTTRAGTLPSTSLEDQRESYGQRCDTESDGFPFIEPIEAAV